MYLKPGVRLDKTEKENISAWNHYKTRIFIFFLSFNLLIIILKFIIVIIITIVTVIKQCVVLSSQLTISLISPIQAWFAIQHRKNGEVGTFKWSVYPSTSQVACSPFFEKWNRRWRLFFTKKGDNLEYGLEYIQGVSPIHLALRYIRRHINSLGLVCRK